MKANYLFYNISSDVSDCEYCGCNAIMVDNIVNCCRRYLTLLAHNLMHNYSFILFFLYLSKTF